MAALDTITVCGADAPVSLVLEVLEVEDTYPSFRCSVSAIVHHPSGRFTYDASDIWFATEDYDRFLAQVTAMTQGTGHRARLRDMSDYVALEIVRDERTTTLALKVLEPFPNQDRAVLTFEGTVDADYPARVLARLAAFQPWW